MSYLRVSGTDKTGMTGGSSSGTSWDPWVATAGKITDKALDVYTTTTGGSRRSSEPPPSSPPGVDFLSQSVAGIPVWMLLAGVGAVILIKRRKG